MIPEPPPGSTVRFTKDGYYTYVCFRIMRSDDRYRWYTTAATDFRDGVGPVPFHWLGKIATWAQIVKFADQDEIEMATQWKPLVRF